MVKKKKIPPLEMTPENMIFVSIIFTAAMGVLFSNSETGEALREAYKRKMKNDHI